MIPTPIWKAFWLKIIHLLVQEKEAQDLIPYKIINYIKQSLSDSFLKANNNADKHQEAINVRKVTTEITKQIIVYRAFLLRKGVISVAREAYVGKEAYPSNFQNKPIEKITKKTKKDVKKNWYKVVSNVHLFSNNMGQLSRLNLHIIVSTYCLEFAILTFIVFIIRKKK